MSGPLAGLRVIEMGTLIAGPYCARLLAEFGAEVIKIEAPDGGDPLRTWRKLHEGTSLWWSVQARNKKSVTVNLRLEAGQEIVRRLARDADIIVENFRPGALEKWGLGYDRLSAENPGLIMVRRSGYGQTGPYRDQPGFGAIGEAMGGLRFVTGYPDRPPVRPGIITSDYLTGVFNALAIMIALYHRDVHRGGGQTVDLALYESVFRILEHTLPAYDRLGVVRGREGNRLRNSAPLDNWETADGQFICIVAAGDGLFPRLARAIGRPELLDDPRFATFKARVANADAINAIVGDWCRQHDAAEIEAIMVAADVPVSRALSIADIAADPHYAARADIVTVDDPTIGPVKQPAVYPRLSATPGEIRRGAPKLGEHNEEIYSGLLGLSAEEIGALRHEGVI